MASATDLISSPPLASNEAPRSSSLSIVGRLRHRIGNLSHRFLHVRGGKAPGAPAPLRIPDLDIVKQLGTGTYGRVLLCTHKSTKSPYVVKCVNKEQTFIKEQQDHILFERNALAALSEESKECVFAVMLYRTLQTPDSVLFVTEYIPGGELYSYIRNDGLPEATAMFYIAQLVLAFDHMHMVCDLVYRDIKPENMLLDAHGNLKLCDFGFAKRVAKGAKTWTICGTPDYMSPETIKGRGYGRSCDVWGLGVLLYELLVGVTPFPAAGGMNHQFSLILRGHYSIPDRISKPAKELIGRLLVTDPVKRLGCSGIVGVVEVFTDPWFHGISKEKLLARAVEPPIKPKLGADPLDTSNFLAIAATSDPITQAPRRFHKPNKQKMDRFFEDFDMVVRPYD